MPVEDPVKRGIYNVEYFSGAQVSLYIGDVWVDEITTFSYQAMQNRRPIYGYASTLYDALSEGQFLVQGQFTINFKEAGYLWLILNRYRKLFQGKDSLTEFNGPFKSLQDNETADRRNIEQIINNELTTFERNRALQDIANRLANRGTEVSGTRRVLQNIASKQTEAGLGGFATATRLIGRQESGPSAGSAGTAEGYFEAFEDAVWNQVGSEDSSKYLHRRPDDPRLNPFEIFVAFGDFAGDNDANHSIIRFEEVSIVGKSQQIVIDGMPIQEQYQFIARNYV